MALPSTKAPEDFTVIFEGTADEYGAALGSASAVQIAFDTRAIENQTQINAIITALSSTTVGDDGMSCIGAYDDGYGSNLAAQLATIKSAGSGTIPPDGTITEAKLATGAVTITKIGADAVDGTKIADDAVDSEHIAAGAIDNEHMAANSIDSDQYVDGSIDTEHLADAAITADKLDASATSNKNYLINGEFKIWQGYGALTYPGGGGQLADRWYDNYYGSSRVITREAFTIGQTDVPGEPQYYHRAVVTSSAGATSYCKLDAHIEDVRTLSNGNLTFSFYGKADSAKNIAIDVVQIFGGGGSGWVYVTPQKFALTDSWAKYEKTFAIPSISGKTIGTSNYLCIRIWYDAGSNYDAYTDTLGQQSGTFDIAMAACNSGSVSLNITPTDYGEELMKCFRYRYTIVPENSYVIFGQGHAISTTVALIEVGLPTQMYDSPSIIREDLDISIGDGVSVNQGISDLAVTTNSASKDKVLLTVTADTAVLTQYRPYFLIGSEASEAIEFYSSI